MAVTTGIQVLAQGSGEPAHRLQEVVRTIAERYRVDPATRRLASKD